MMPEQERYAENLRVMEQQERQNYGGELKPYRGLLTVTVTVANATTWAASKQDAVADFQDIRVEDLLGLACAVQEVEVHEDDIEEVVEHAESL